MEHGQYTVAIPYFPVLTTDVYEGYKFGGESATFTTEKPDILYGAYPTTKRGVAGYLVLPEGWENGYYWTVDALSNYALSDLCSDADREMIHKQLAVMQQLCYDKAAEMQKAIAGMSTNAAKEYATAQSARLQAGARADAAALQARCHRRARLWRLGGHDALHLPDRGYRDPDLPVL